jgi:hypothetical protein
MNRRLRAPSPALVISLLALFVALGGTTYAATSLPRHSVGTAQLRNGAVTKKKLNKRTIHALKGEQGPQGVPGLQGVQGPKGLQGPKGDSGPAGTVRAYAEVDRSGGLGISHNVGGGVVYSPGVFCVEVDPSVPVAATGAVVSPWAQQADNGTQGVTLADFAGYCGTNGVSVDTYLVAQGTTDLNVQPTTEGFFVAIP